MREIATVRDGNISEVEGAPEDDLRDSAVLILSDSQAAIAVVKKVGRTGRARTVGLRRVMMDIKGWRTRLGPNAELSDGSKPITRFTSMKWQASSQKPWLWRTR